MLPAESLVAIKSRFEFSATAEPTGNLTMGRGRAYAGVGKAAVPIHVAIVENKIASGSLGVKECDKLASLFTVVAAQKRGLVLYLDSAGARVSEGLAALGAFRYMYRAALDAVASGAPLLVICGGNCFGGASMLAALAGSRGYTANTRFAMSGPAILAQAAGISALDDIFMAMSMAAISGTARARLGAQEAIVANPLSTILPAPAANALLDRHHALGERLAADQTTEPGRSGKLERKDLAKLYPDGYWIEERNGVLSGEARCDGQRVTLAGFVGGKLLGAAGAWAQADAVWKMLVPAGSATKRPHALHVLVDCESHATSLDDERIMLSAYLADLACALHALAQAGTRIETTILGKLGGGVYVALCAPATRVNLLYGAEIHVLPGRALASILGETNTQKIEFAEYQATRVADRELKLGIV